MSRGLPERLAGGVGKVLAWLALSLLLGAQAAAQDAVQDFPPAPLGPHEIVRQGVDELVRFLSDARQPGAEQIRGFLDRHVAAHFDFTYMARWAAGPYHRRLSETQRAALAAHLAETFLTALARNLGVFATPAPVIEVSPQLPGRTASEVAVLARVVLDSSFLMQLEFRFYHSPEGWKIFDVAANGASAVAYYRRYYTEQLRRHGPDAFVH